MNAKILNRKLEDSDSLPEWYQIEVSGEHPAGKGRVQVIDGQSRAAVVADFNARAPQNGPVLIDADHLSHDLRNSTEAYGWLHELREVGGEIWGRIEWTDLGEPAIRNKRFRFFSTEYPADGIENVSPGKVRPVSLSGLALTNRPNNRGGRPIINRFNRGENADEPTKKQNMKAIAKKLGLEESADEAAILAKIGSLLGEKKEAEEGLKNRDAELETYREREADALIEKFGERIGDNAELRGHFRAEAIKNREATEKLLAALPEKAPDSGTRQPIHNRATAKTPDPVEGAERADDKAGAKIFNRAKEIQAAEGLSWSRAFARAKSE